MHEMVAKIIGGEASLLFSVSSIPSSSLLPNRSAMSFTPVVVAVVARCFVAAAAAVISLFAYSALWQS
jgi:hypothetical protein